MLQLMKYNEERINLQKLLPTVPEIRRKTFLKNFKANLEKIHESIINNYQHVLNELKNNLEQKKEDSL